MRWSRKAVDSGTDSNQRRGQKGDHSEMKPKASGSVKAQQEETPV
jgi:hypothetical protein